jgi:hypothetical protein
MRVCTRCLRSGAIRKIVRRKPFKLPTEVKSKAKAKANAS